MPALAIKSLALSPVNADEIFAGSGSTSNFGLAGNPGFGVVWSGDGGVNWEVRAASTFTGSVINSIVPTTLQSGRVVLAATDPSAGGVWRSINSGKTFTKISGTLGIPGGGVSSLVADDTNPKFFFAALPASTIVSPGDEGVYRSIDGGVSWVKTTLSLPAGSNRILLSVGKHTGVIFAMTIGPSGTLKDVSRSADHGVTWTSLGVPEPSHLSRWAG